MKKDSIFSCALLVIGALLCILKFTGIVNNSNIGEETTRDDILSSVEYANKLSKLTGLPIYATTVKESLSEEISKEITDVFPISLYVKQSWQ